MKKGFISDFVEHYPKALTSVLVFVLAGLSFLCNQLNFDIPASTKVRDAASFAEPFSEAEKIDLHSISSAVPATNYTRTYYAPVRYASYTVSNYSAPAGADFTIYPVSTNDSSYIGPYESNTLAYKSNFLFGHSTGPLNWVKSAYEGNTIAINRNGATETYRIVKKITLPLTDVKKVYYSISEYVTYRGQSYSIALMTCGDGTYGAHGNDNNYRTFLFAERI